MTFEEIDAYLNRLHFSADYKALTEQEREDIIFEATEFLKDFFREDELTARAVALQTLFMLEGEGEEFARLRRQGVKSYSVKGVSVTLEGSGVSPSVVRLLRPNDADGNSRGRVGRLI